jgi:hypothetical protein
VCKECQIPEESSRYSNGIPYIKDHKETPSKDGRIISDRIFAKLRLKTGASASRIEGNGKR